ncbi:MAG: RNA polymerase sigma factor [Candidatus Eiseniibacteriota bacterium]
MTEPASRRQESPEPDDRELVLAAQSGSRRAFGMLVRRHQRRVFGLGVRLLGTSHDADDLVQETFLRAWRALDRLDAERPVIPWLLRIATNRAMTMLSARGRRAAEVLDEDLPAAGTRPDESAERAQLLARVSRALAALSDEQRIVLSLRASEGLSYLEIAAMLDVPVGTVMSRLARARETMRRMVPR